ncbi:MAG TPA: aminotransferase class IV [Vicinamibacterales bacterium]|jgi:branched-chain amino acid aminotransferase|nr:aminotransferase class IV [Vicinamibacterales bacterium]
MQATVNVNGRVFDQEHATISVFDHGFLYGEGVYETLRTYGGRPFLFDRHMTRLRASARALAIEVPLTDAEIGMRFEQTMKAAGLGVNGREAYIRILVTRGVGDLSYDPAACPEPSIVIIAKPHADVSRATLDAGVTIIITTVVRNHPGSVNPVIKSNNLINSALAMQEAVRKGAFEGLMRNYRGEIAELSTANIFIVKDGVAMTPPLDAGLLAGLTREFVLELAADGHIPTKEQVLKDADLFGADEAFLTSTTREIVPIVQVDDRKIGAGVPGPVTQTLLAAFHRRANA